MKEKTWRFIRRMLISGAVFCLISIPCHNFFSLVPGMTEIRPANMIPPVLGLLFGLPAAIGISVGNLISDIVGGSGAFVCITGFLANFLYAYLPYRMWYTIGKKDEVELPHLNTLNGILKYIGIIFVDSLTVTTLLAFIFESAGFATFSSGAPLLFFNNFDFAILLGVPALIILSNSGVKPQVLKIRKENMVEKKFWKVLRVIPYICFGYGITYFIYSIIRHDEMNPTLTMVSLIILNVLMYIYMLRCRTKPLTEVTKKNVRFSIKAKVTVGFLIIATLFIIILAGSIYQVATKNGSYEHLDLWNTMYLIIGVAINLIFAATLIFLWYVEKNMTSPIETLNELVMQFAKEDHAGKNDDRHIKDQCKAIKTRDEIEQLSLSCSKMMSEIENYVKNLATVTAEKERIGAELNVATHIQSSMLPCIFPAFPDRSEFDIYATMNPAKEVGGDFYDFFMVDDQHLAIVMADVSGKGVPAALFMVIGKTLIKDHTMPGRELSEVFTDVNNLLCDSNSEGLFITAFEGVLNLVTGEFCYVNAGHEFPYIYKQDNSYEIYKLRPGFVLAGMEDMRFKSGIVNIDVGDRIYLYTDGVTEATNANNELYGNSRLEQVLNENRKASPHELLPIVKENIDEFVGEAPQFDDITMLCVEFKEKMEG